MDAWATHTWRKPKRVFNIGGEFKRECFCIRCRRRFVELVESQQRFAAYPSIFDFEPLAPDVTARWLSEPCPGKELTADARAYIERPRRQVETVQSSLSEKDRG
jgi:hypothetical protein